MTSHSRARRPHLPSQDTSLTGADTVNDPKNQ